MTKLLTTFALALMISANGCASRVDVEDIPIGTEVAVTRHDGGVVSGTLTARDDETVNVAVGPASRSVPIEQIAEVQFVDEATPVALPAIAMFREFTVPQGTTLAVRLAAPISSDSSRVGDTVEATLTDAVVVDGTVVLPAGSVFTGAVTEVKEAGRVKGRASLTLQFRSISVTEHDESYSIATPMAILAPATKGADAAKIGAPAAGGAIIGAILGGKKGALIGAAIGGGGGAAVVLMTPGEEIRLPAGTALALQLDRALEVRVPIDRS